MGKIYFWQGLVADPSQFALYQETLGKLLRGEYQAADLDLKRLNGHRVYSARINKSDRLLFTTINMQGKPSLLLLEVVKDHNYQKSRFLKPGVLSHYLDKHFANLPQSVITEDSFGTVSLLTELPAGDKISEIEKIKPAPIDFYNQTYIELSTEQMAARSTSLPAVVSGPPGSGKSCVALSLLGEMADREEKLPRPLLFLTQSSFLKNTLEKMWQTLPIAQSLEQNVVQFRTFEEWLLELLPEARSKTLVGQANFQKWFTHYAATALKLEKIRPQMPGLEQFLEKYEGSFYQELRLLSGYSKEDYLKLGKKQTLISELSQRVWIWEMGERYRQSLKKEEKIHPSIFQWTSEIRYGCIIVDEAQDFSLLELKTAYELAGKRVCYFMDTHQSLDDVISKRAQLLEFLAQQGKVNHLQLSAAYRCPQNVVNLANCVIKIKTYLSGGIADKDEFATITTSACQSNTSAVHWLTATDTEVLQALKQSALSTDFAVVTLPEFKEEASRLFSTPLVFSAEEIKGLEYHTVVAYRLFDHPLFETASLILPSNDDELRNAPCHRAKESRRDDRFGPYFNKVFTCFTRAKHTLVIYQDTNHKLHKLLAFLQKSNLQTFNQTVTVLEPARQEDWQQEAQRQEHVGNIEQAKRIYDRNRIEKQSNILPSAKAFTHISDVRKKNSQAEPHKRPLSPHTSSMPPNLSINLQQVTENDLVKWFKNGSLFAAIKEEGTCLFLKLISSDDHLVLIEEVINRDLSCLKIIIAHLYRCYPNESLLVTWVKNDKAQGLLNSVMDLSKRRLASKITPEALYEASPGELSLFSWLTTTTQGVNFLLNLYRFKPSLKKKVTWQALTKIFPLDDLRRYRIWEAEDITPLYLLAMTIGGQEVLALLLEDNPSLIKKISIEILTFYLKTGEYKNASLFYWLSRDEGRELLFQIFEKNHKLIKNIKAEDLGRFLLAESNKFENTSALFWLSNSSTGQEILFLLFQNNLDLINTISVADLVRVVTLRKPKNIENTSPLYWLCGTPKGQEILDLILKNNPDLAKKLSAEDVGRQRQNSLKNEIDSPLYWLITTKTGHQVLFKLIMENFSIITELSANFLSNKSPDGRGTVVDELLNSNIGKEILLILLKHNQALKETFPQLVSILVYSSENNNNNSGTNHQLKFFEPAKKESKKEQEDPPLKGVKLE